MSDLAPSTSLFPFPFRAAVVRELEVLGFEIVAWNAEGVELRDETGTTKFLNLANIHRETTLHEPDQSGEIVRNYFDRIFNPSVAAAEELPRSLEAGAERLLLRVGTVPTEDERALWSVPIPGTAALQLNLVFDYPTMMAYATRAMVDASTQPVAYWLQKAHQNLVASTPENWLQVLHADEGVYFSNTQDSYDAARSLIFCELTQSDGLGWLITIPARDLLFARKVEPAGIPHFHILKLIATDAVAKYPYPITDDVYWIRPNRDWVLIPIEINDDKVNISPPMEFAEALNITLAEATSEPDAESQPTGADSKPMA